MQLLELERLFVGLCALPIRKKDEKGKNMIDKTTKQELTQRQNEIYQFVIKYTKEHLYHPTFQEIQNATQTGKSEVSRMLKLIEKKGYIELLPYSPRAIKLKGYRLVNVSTGE